MAHLKQSNDQMTPDASRKRNIMETVSPSDGPDGEYVNSPNPVRRKEYSSPDAGGDTNFIVEGKSFDLSELVKSAVCSQEVMDAISAAIVPSLTVVFNKMLKPINDKLDDQSRRLTNLNEKHEHQKKTVADLEYKNHKLRSELHEADERIDTLERSLDDLEQYGRRTSIRFHRVLLYPSGDSNSSSPAGKKSSGNPQGSNPGSNTNTTNKPDTDEIVLDICNNMMKVTPPISVDDIERSHTIGPVRGGYGQILCKFKCWKTKTRVFMAKSNLKHHSSTGFKVFVTEDLTRKRQFMVQQLDQARKDKKIESFWTSDGRILYKNNPKDRVRSIRSVAGMPIITFY